MEKVLWGGKYNLQLFHTSVLSALLLWPFWVSGVRENRRMGHLLVFPINKGTRTHLLLDSQHSLFSKWLRDIWSWKPSQKYRQLSKEVQGIWLMEMERNSVRGKLHLIDPVWSSAWPSQVSWSWERYDEVTEGLILSHWSQWEDWLYWALFRC